MRPASFSFANEMQQKSYAFVTQSDGDYRAICTTLQAKSIAFSSQFIAPYNQPVTKAF